MYSVLDIFNIPRGSAFLNLLARGCLSRLGRDWTKRSVCDNVNQAFANLDDRAHVFATDGLDDIVRGCAEKLSDD